MAASTSSAAFYPPYPPSSSSSFASLTSFASSRNSRGVGEVIHTGRLEGRITRLKAERDQLRRLVKRLQSKIAATSTAQTSNTTTLPQSGANAHDDHDNEDGDGHERATRALIPSPPQEYFPTAVDVGVQCCGEEDSNTSSSKRSTDKRLQAPGPSNTKKRMAKLIRVNQVQQRRIQSLMKANERQVEQIATLATESRRSQERLDAAQDETVKLERQVSSLRLACKNAKKEAADYAATSVKNPVLVALRKDIHELEMKNMKVVDENHRLRAELRGFDSAFFEEIEDLKYNLFSANALNKQLEATIKRLAAGKGVALATRLTTAR